MQGRSEDQRDLLDVESVAGHLLKPGSVFAFLISALASYVLLSRQREVVAGALNRRLSRVTARATARATEFRQRIDDGAAAEDED